MDSRREKARDHIQKIMRGDRKTFTDRIKLKLDGTNAHRETLPKDADRFPGVKIVWFDAIPTREGVMNGGLKPWDELVKAAPTLDMAWVTKDHPADGWIYDAEDGIGFCRNTTPDAEKRRLHTQLCIFDNEKNAIWIKAIEMGIKDENSMGFTCKMTLPPELEDMDEDTWFNAMMEGTLEDLLPVWEDEEFGPRLYDHIQTDIFFNHDAILDAGDGACGSDYGCLVGAGAEDSKEDKMLDEEKKQLSDCQEAIDTIQKRHTELADAVAEILKIMKVSEGDKPTDGDPPVEPPVDPPAEPESDGEPADDEPIKEKGEPAEPEGDASETVTVEVRIPGVDTRPGKTGKTSAADRLAHMSIGGRQPDGTYPGEKRYNKE